MPNFLGTFANGVKRLGNFALNGARSIGSKVGDIADKFTPALSKVGLGGLAKTVGDGGRFVSGVASNIKSITDKLPPVSSFTTPSMG